MTRTKSLIEWQSEAAKYITGGMSSSFRANYFTGVPMYVQEARGPRFTDLAGKKYIDFFMCNGAVLLGHDRPEIKKALTECLDKGFFAGYDSKETIQFASTLCSIIPSAEEIRFVNSGTEGTLLALRLARGFTKRNVVIRMDGHFHGIQDYLTANNLAGKVDYKNDGTRPSEVIGRTAGVPDLVDQVVITIPWNNIQAMRDVFIRRGEDIACVIMNPIDYNNGLFLTSKEYLLEVRALCDKNGSLLIFDEILCGFKTGLSCAQGYYGVTPDITTLAKALTNDIPLGIVAGKSSIMSKIMDPADPVIAGGTFSGNQLGLAAGIAALDVMKAEGFYQEFQERTHWFYGEINSLFLKYSFPGVAAGLGAGFHIYLGVESPPKNYFELRKVDYETAKKFFIECMERGLYFHTDFTVSSAHDKNTLSEALEIFESVILSLKK